MMIRATWSKIVLLLLSISCCSNIFCSLLEKTSFDRICVKYQRAVQQQKNALLKKRVGAVVAFGAAVGGAVLCWKFWPKNKSTAPSASDQAVPSLLTTWVDHLKLYVAVGAIGGVSSYVLNQAIPYLWHLVHPNRNMTTVLGPCGAWLEYSTQCFINAVKMFDERACSGRDLTDLRKQELHDAAELFVRSLEKTYATMLCEMHTLFGKNDELYIYWYNAIPRICEQVNDVIQQLEGEMQQEQFTSFSDEALYALTSLQKNIRNGCSNYVAAFTQRG